MNRKGFIPVVAIAVIGFLAAIAAGGIFILKQQVVPKNVARNPHGIIVLAPDIPPEIMCAADAKQCPDGTFVERIAPSCDFAPCPSDPIGNFVGNDHDAHGCIGSAGYSWCEAKQKCLRKWEEVCEMGKVAPTETASSTTETSLCMNGERRMAIPTSTLFQVDADAGPFHDGSACFNLIATSTLVSPDGTWTVSIERDVNHLNYETLIYDFSGIGGPRFGDWSGNIFLVFTNNETLEQKKISFISIAPPEVVSHLKSVGQPGTFFIESNIVEWSSDGTNLWGSWYLRWEGDDMGRASGGSLFRINTMNWKTDIFPFAPGAVYASRLNADRGSVIGTDVTVPFDSYSGPWPKGQFAGTSSVVLYDVPVNASSVLASYNATSDCYDAFRYCSLDNASLAVPQWIDSSTAVWHNPITYVTTTWSYVNGLQF